MFRKEQLLAILKFWGGDNKDRFSKIMRIVLYAGYFFILFGGALTGPTFSGNDPWWEIMGAYFLMGGFLTIILGHVLLGYASYRKQPQFKKPTDPSRHMFKQIFLFMYLPAMVIAGVLFVVLTLASN